MPEKTLTVGASIATHELAPHIDWLVESQRDLELLCYTGLLTGDTVNGWKTDLQAARALLTNYHGRVGIHGPIQPSFAVLDQESREVIIRQFTRALEACGEFGMTHMVIHSPFLSLGQPIPGQTTDMWLLNPARAVMDVILPIAERVGCKLMMETIYDTQLELLIGFIKSYNSPYLRLSLDTGHAYVMHRWGAGPAPDHWIRAAGSLLEHVHLQDTDGYTDRHWPLGEGSLPWFAIFNALAELDQQPRLILELQSKDLPRALAYLERTGFAR